VDDAYRTWKFDKVRALLAAKGIEPETWNDPVFLPSHSRRRAHFSVFKNAKTMAVGYHKRRSNIVINAQDCLLLDPELQAVKIKLEPFLDGVISPKIEYDLFVQQADNGFDVTLTGAVGPNKRPTLRMLEAVAELVQNTNIIRFSWRGRQKDDPEVLVEREKPHTRFGDLAVNLPPLAFLQPSVAGQAALVDAVMRYMPQGCTRAVDLFSGCGTFTGAMVENIKHVDAFEGDENAILALRSAHPNAFVRDLFADPLMVSELNQYDLIVMDPPRAGAKAQSEMLSQSGVPTIISVSCNPVTFARDALLLLNGGYRLKALQMVDQFIWSDHTELVGLFEK